MHAKEILASPALRGLLSALEPRPGRAQETLRITVAALLVTELKKRHTVLPSAANSGFRGTRHSLRMAGTLSNL